MRGNDLKITYARPLEAKNASLEKETPLPTNPTKNMLCCLASPSFSGVLFFNTSLNRKHLDPSLPFPGQYLTWHPIKPLFFKPWSKLDPNSSKVSQKSNHHILAVIMLTSISPLIGNQIKNQVTLRITCVGLECWQLPKKGRVWGPKGIVRGCCVEHKDSLKAFLPGTFPLPATRKYLRKSTCWFPQNWYPLVN